MNVNLMFNEQKLSHFDKNGIQSCGDVKIKAQTFYSNQSGQMLAEKYKNFDLITTPPTEQNIPYSSSLNPSYPSNLLTSQNENVMLNSPSHANCLPHQKSSNCSISNSSVLVKNINDENNAATTYHLFETNIRTNSSESFSQPLTSPHLKTKQKKSKIK